MAEKHWWERAIALAPALIALIREGIRCIGKSKRLSHERRVKADDLPGPGEPGRSEGPGAGA